jgi:hypothetical protein
MSKSTFVSGFKPPDKKWKEMKDVWESCKNAGVTIPPEVEEFFEYGSPNAAGVEVDLDTSDCVREYLGEDEYGYDILIDKLPKDVKIVRVYTAC